MKWASQKQTGFTIVELLIVVVVIAILAAITITAYNGIAKQAIDASVQTDLQNARIAIENAKTLAGGEIPPDIAAVSVGGAIQASGNNQLFYLRSNTHYCVAVINSQTKAASYISNTESKATPGMCPVNVSTPKPGWWATQGVAIDSSGTLYVGNSNLHRVEKIPVTGSATVLAGSGSAGNADGTGTGAQFNSPSAGFAIANDGAIYVADRNNHCIRKVTQAGVVTTHAGLCGTSGIVNGVGTSARFNSPAGLAFDSAGNLYVADRGNNRIRKIDTGVLVSTLAGTGAYGYVDGTALTAQFNGVMDVDVDPLGNVYVAESGGGNSSIRKITSSGVVSTVARSVGATGYADGLGLAAKFSYIEGIAVDASGNIYFPDAGNHRIRMINPNGYMTTLAGTGVSAHVNGTGSVAQFGSPRGITIGADGSLYVVEWSNTGIRKIQL